MVKFSTFLMLALVALPLAHGFATSSANLALVGARSPMCPQQLPVVPALQRGARHEPVRMQGGTNKEEGGGKLKELVAKYGRVALLSHLTIQGLAYAVVYTLVTSLGDSAQLIQQLPEALSSKIDPSAGTLAVTFVLVKTTMPARLLIDAAITPKLAVALAGTPFAGPLGLSKKPV